MALPFDSAYAKAGLHLRRTGSNSREPGMRSSSFAASFRRILVRAPGDVSKYASALVSSSPDGSGGTPSSGKTFKPGPNIAIALAVAVPIVIVAILGLLCFSIILCLRKRRGSNYTPKARRRGENLARNFSDGSKIYALGSWIMSWHSKSFLSCRTPSVWLSSACEMQFSLLQSATDNFSPANILGEGGSGRVYRARLDDDALAAVKWMENARPRALAEFQGEVNLMRQVRHPNLVSLLGYCQQGQRSFLVYEFMPNGSVEDQLYGPSNGKDLSWNLRMKIALESARGLEYLHEHCVPPVVHRDFKASNILLDADFNAKISDFGLATPLEGLTRQQSLQLIGTIGYVAPEFFETGTLTEKSDVYSFGVTLLELLTRRKPVDHSRPPDEYSLVNWAKPQVTDRRKLPLLVDEHVRPQLTLKHLYQVAAVAALCVQTEPDYRPLIADVVQSLIPLVPVEMGGALRKEPLHLQRT